MGQLCIHNNMNLDSYLTLHVKINLNFIIDKYKG